MEGEQSKVAETEKVRRTPMQFLKKYLIEGQSLQENYQQKLDGVEFSTLPWYQKIWIKHRRLFAMLMPASFIILFWLAYFIKYDYWYIFKEDGNYRMAIMAIFGSLIAGLSSEGGGSVFFPVMTLALSIKPKVARDFSMILQSCGMTAASIAILWMRIQVEWHAIICCTFGGLFGIILSLEEVDHRLTPPVKKMGFVSLFFAFAFALFLLNRIHKRVTFKQIPQFCPWKAVVLIITGFVGGIFTGISGTGIDICCFSILTLLFRVSEKTATPTSIVLMAINSIIGMYWTSVMMPITYEAWRYVSVCIEIVVIGAPLGSIIGSHFHRQALASLNYITDTVALISGFAIVPLDAVVIGVSIGVIAFGFAFYLAIVWLGGKLLSKVLENEEYSEQDVEEEGEENMHHHHFKNKAESSNDIKIHASKDNEGSLSEIKIHASKEDEKRM